MALLHGLQSPHTASARLPASDSCLGVLPTAPMDGCWSHCRDPLWDVPIERSSQGRSAVILTHVAGPVSFCRGAHTPGRKLWAGRAPRRKTSGCSDVPRGWPSAVSRGIGKEGHLPNCQAPQGEKSCLCVNAGLRCVCNLQAGWMPFPRGHCRGDPSPRNTLFTFSKVSLRVPPAEFRSVGHLLWPVSCGQ